MIDEIDWDMLAPKLDDVEDALKRIGSPRDVIPLLIMIMGRYTAIGLPSATVDEALAQVMPHFRILFAEGFRIARSHGPS
jgi:hypothetical protein